MHSLKWSTSHSVFVPEIDDEHKEIFQALSNLQRALAGHAPSLDIQKLTQSLISCIAGHFAHEERLMRAARYSSIRWHKQAHDHARRRVGEFARRIEQGDSKAGPELVEYLTSWLHDHTRLADRMMGAFLRNQQRCMWKLTFRAGTKPPDACAWVDTHGNTFDPKVGEDYT
jgi:hemerythrin